MIGFRNKSGNLIIEGETMEYVYFVSIFVAVFVYVGVAMFGIIKYKNEVDNRCEMGDIDECRKISLEEADALLLKHEHFETNIKPFLSNKGGRINQ
jgi:hypothetical protein